MSLITGLGGINLALSVLPLKKAAPLEAAAPKVDSGLQTETRQRSPSLTSAEEVGKKGAAEEFLDFMAMTPAEKLRYTLLSGMGLSEEQLAALPPEEREQIEQKIEEVIKERLGLQANEDLHAPLRPATALNLSLIQQIQANEENRPKVDVFS